MKKLFFAFVLSFFCVDAFQTHLGSAISFAEESVGDKVDNAAGDVKTETKKAVRKGKRKWRKARGKNHIGHDVKDKVEDAGDDISNEANKKH